MRTDRQLQRDRAAKQILVQSQLSALAWEGAVDGYGADSDDATACAESAERCADLYTDCSTAAEKGDLKLARQCLDEARALESEYGNSEHADASLRILTLLEEAQRKF